MADEERKESRLLIPGQSEIVVPRDSLDRLVSLWLHGKSPASQRAYRSDVDRFLRFVGKPIHQVTLGDLQDYAAQLDVAGLAAATRSRRLAAVKSLLAFGCRLGLLPVDVGQPLKLPKRKDTLAERILTEDEVKRLIAATRTERDRALVTLMYVGGLRVSEACNLRWRDVKARKEGAQCTVLGKGSKTRVVLISASCYELVLRMKGKSGPNEPVFRSQKKGALSTVQAWRIVHRAAEDADLELGASPHFLRHSHASHALDHGAPISLVRDTLGHASLETTGRYLHAKPNESSSRFLPDV